MGSDQDVPPGNEGRSSDAPTKVASLTPIEAPSPSSATISQGKPDFGWLSEIISKRVEELKRYPAMARADRLEGRVVIRAVVKDDGHLADIQIAKSSGHETLDRAAIEVLQQAFPVPMLRALGKPRVTIHVPLSYRLDR
jgi:protein TonB